MRDEKEKPGHHERLCLPAVPPDEDAHLFHVQAWRDEEVEHEPGDKGDERELSHGHRLGARSAPISRSRRRSSLCCFTSPVTLLRVSFRPFGVSRFASRHWFWFMCSFR